MRRRIQILNQSIDEELPAPLPGRSLISNPIGTPIYITAPGSITLTSYQVLNTASNTPASTAKVMQGAGDGLPGNELAILPNAPLATNTLYSVCRSAEHRAFRTPQRPVGSLLAQQATEKPCTSYLFDAIFFYAKISINAP